jgi:hypothetical protein
VNVKSRCLPHQTLFLSAFENGLRLMRSARYVLARFRAAPPTIRNIVARVERGFAHFAKIPYDNSLAPRELLALLDQLAAERVSAQSEKPSFLSRCERSLPHHTPYPEKRRPPTATRKHSLGWEDRTHPLVVNIKPGPRSTRRRII